MNVLELENEPFVSLTTFKRDGTAVSTPVWVARDDGRLLVWTASDTWKVRRIRRDAHVRVTPCSPRGKPRGGAVEARAVVLSETARVEQLLARKYGFRFRLVQTSVRVMKRLRPRPGVEPVTIAIEPVD